MDRKIEIVSDELIKPTSSTPNHLRTFEFSLLDQMAFPTSVPIALFYPAPPPSVDAKTKADNSSKLIHLKKSLSETLTRFYPFGGRIKGNSIECNDDGVPFYEAVAHNYRLEDVLRQPNVDIHFLPTGEGCSVFDNGPFPLLVQVTFLECGGMCIGIRASHKVGDRSTLCTFIDAWTVTSRGRGDLIPELVAAAKFLPQANPDIPVPSLTNSNSVEEVTKLFFDKQNVTKIFVFDQSSIASLKAKATVPTPTRVEVVSAAIWKCAMTASGRTKSTSSYLLHNVNIRKRVVPPMPSHCVGNVVANASSCKGENDDTDFPTLVTCIRKGLSELSSKFADKERKDEAIMAIPQEAIKLQISIMKGEIDLLINSWCGYKFYDIDFGWGKPSWVSPIEHLPKNLIIFMDSKETGGIEAWICLNEKQMEVFEQELHQLLAIGCA